MHSLYILAVIIVRKSLNSKIIYIQLMREIGIVFLLFFLWKCGHFPCCVLRRGLARSEAPSSYLGRCLLPLLLLLLPWLNPPTQPSQRRKVHTVSVHGIGGLHSAVLTYGGVRQVYCTELKKNKGVNTHARIALKNKWYCYQKLKVLCCPGKCSAFQLLQEYLDNVPVALRGRGEADLAGAKRGGAEVHKTNKERNSNEFSNGYHTGNRGTL